MDDAPILRPATENDVPLILRFIRELSQYERLAHEVVATEEAIRETLFGPRPYAEVIIAEIRQPEPAAPLDDSKTRRLDDSPSEPVGFALFFHNYSTFLGRPGLYLEDLYVRPEMRGRGYGKALLVRLAQIALERNCGRFEWAVLNWNEPAIRFYRSLGALPQDAWTVYRVKGETLHALASI
jgi:GNAT superfamily N-acetyltransferase